MARTAPIFEVHIPLGRLTSALPRAALLIGLLAFGGCATYSVPPRSDFTVQTPVSVDGATMAVVLDANTFLLDDASAVATHVGGGDDPKESMRELLAVVLPRALREEAPFGAVTVLDAAALTGSLADIAAEAGTDLVLVVDGFHQYRARYQTPMMMGSGGSQSQAVRQDVDYRLWDARAGAEVASGRVESEEQIPLVPNRRNYVGAVEEMAEKLTHELGVRTR